MGAASTKIALSREQTRPGRWRLGGPEEPIAQHNRSDYQYDAHGNWTERVGSYRIGSQGEFQRSNVERRTITYYDDDRR